MKKAALSILLLTSTVCCKAEEYCADLQVEVSSTSCIPATSTTTLKVDLLKQIAALQCEVDYMRREWLIAVYSAEDWAHKAEHLRIERDALRDCLKSTTTATSQ